MKILRDMALFAAVGELQNFGRAADRLGMPTSSLSRRIAEMESELGVRLLDRNTRRVRLTDEGLTFLESCQDLMRRASAAQDSIRGLMGGQNGKVRLTLSQSFGATRILPAIPKFCDRYRDISFEVEQTAGGITTTGSNFDVAFMTGTLRDSSLVARRLFDIQRVLCVSPSLLGRNSAPATPSDLQKLRYASLTSETRNPLRVRHALDHHVVEITCSASISTHDETSLLAMVLAGAGVAAIDQQLANDAIAHGRLVALLPSWTLASTPMWAVTTAKLLPQRISLFLDFLSNENPLLKNTCRPSTFAASVESNTLPHHSVGRHGERVLIQQ